MDDAHQGNLFGAKPPPAQVASAPAKDDPPATEAAGGANPSAPLAARLRPRKLEEVVGQDHLLGSGALLPRLIRQDSFGSLLFYGPPGCGKTTFAEVIAAETKGRFLRLNAVLANVAELRDLLRYARSIPQERPILFIDELHRFNKAQQDLLLPDVEAGHVRLIGATTHNPGFYVIPPLLSRSHLFKLEPVRHEVIAEVLQRAVQDTERGLGNRAVTLTEDLAEGLARMADGDLRRALNALETLVLSIEEGAALTGEDLATFARERQIRYDGGEDEHYDTASAYIKSMRGSDPDAALYWLAKMLEGGEEPRFIARRLVILASEDIGLADSRALGVAVNAFQAVEFVGLPECTYALAHATVFLATCPKSNAAGVALAAARKSLREEGTQPVPLWLRDGHTKLNRSLGHGKDYLYSHDFPEAISGQEYMLEPKTFYQPTSHGAEAAIAQRLAQWQEIKRSLQQGSTASDQADD